MLISKARLKANNRWKKYGCPRCGQAAKVVSAPYEDRNIFFAYCFKCRISWTLGFDLSVPTTGDLFLEYVQCESVD